MTTGAFFSPPLLGRPPSEFCSTPGGARNDDDGRVFPFVSEDGLADVCRVLEFDALLFARRRKNFFGRDANEVGGRKKSKGARTSKKDSTSRESLASQAMW